MFAASGLNSVWVGDYSWLGWALIGVMILLQLIILVLIAGRPRAFAVLAFGLPVLCGVCAVTGTALVLYYIDRGIASGGGIPHSLIDLLYLIWVICGIVALVTVILCVVSLRRQPFAPPPPLSEAKPAPPSTPEVARTKP